MKKLFTLVTLVALAGCTSTVDVRGKKIANEDLAKIRFNETTKAEVLEIFGSPTSVVPFEPNTWLYLERTMEESAFSNPKILEGQTLKVTFNKEGKVHAINDIDLKKAKEIAHVLDKTPTAGHSTSFLQQMFGNIGRFNSGKAKTQP